MSPGPFERLSLIFGESDGAIPHARGDAQDGTTARTNGRMRSIDLVDAAADRKPSGDDWQLKQLNCCRCDKSIHRFQRKKYEVNGKVGFACDGESISRSN
jgi:hypothetical protein